MSDQESPRLKPCPFCGYTDIEMHPARPWPMAHGWMVICNGCGAQTGEGAKMVNARDAWNMRDTVLWSAFSNPEGKPGSVSYRERAEMLLEWRLHGKLPEALLVTETHATDASIDRTGQLELVARRIVEWVRAIDDDTDPKYITSPDCWSDIRETAAMARAIFGCQP